MRLRSRSLFVLAVAAWSADKRELTLAVVNPTREERALGLDCAAPAFWARRAAT